jgi:molecular chaperone DnaK
MSEGGTARLRSATENIERALHNVAEVLYKANQTAGAAQAGAAGAGAGAGAGAPGGSSAGGSQQQKKPDDVIDAEYVDVDESKRPN